MMQQDFQVFQAGVIVWENVAFTIAAVAVSEKLIQVSDPLSTDCSVLPFNCSPEQFGDAAVVGLGHWSAPTIAQ